MPVRGKIDDETRVREFRFYVERRKSNLAESPDASRRHVGDLIGVGVDRRPAAAGRPTKDESLTSLNRELHTSAPWEVDARRWTPPPDFRSRAHLAQLEGSAMRSSTT